MLTLAGSAHGVATVLASSGSSGSSISGYVLPLIILLLVVFFIVNSRRRQKTLAAARQREQDEWGPGTEVVTRAGLIATVVERNHDHVVLEVAPGVRTRYVPEAIGKRWYPEDEPPDPAPPEVEPGHADEPQTDDRLAD